MRDCNAIFSMTLLCRICCRGRMYLLRRRVLAAVTIAVGLVFTVLLFSFSSGTLTREDAMDSRLVHLNSEVSFMRSLYQQRSENLLALQGKLQSLNSSKALTRKPALAPPTELLAKYAGTKTGSGFENLKLVHIPILYHVMTHLLDDEDGLRPAFHMTAGRRFADVVIGVPTVKRDKYSYWMETLQSLVKKLSDEEKKTTLIVLFIGEVDLEYVTEVAYKIEQEFPKEVASGLIEVLSPSPSFYPDLDSVPLSLGDSKKRVKWRTKQNLDTLYLMGYAQAKGTYYLMLEDDVLAKDNFMKQIKTYLSTAAVSNPGWFYIDFCNVGGIGKFFHSSDLLHFITYIQLFYANMPIDWLLECYLADKVCAIYKHTVSNSSDAATNQDSIEDCVPKKLKIRPRYKAPLFEHIGLYSSLKGKLQETYVKGRGTKSPEFFPHANPPVETILCPLEAHKGHTIEAVYEGKSFFWGSAPRNGTIIEFKFKTPIVLDGFTIRSGNVKHTKDHFYDSVVEVLPSGGNYTFVAKFDEFGLADSVVDNDLGPISAMRIRTLSSSTYWVIISEIEIKEHVSENS